MATIRFCRADNYKRGDMIIQICVDGDKAGSLIGAAALDVELPAGAHTVQARMFGQKGPAMVLDLQSGQRLELSVSGTRSTALSTGFMIAWLASYFVPGGKLEWMRWALIAIVWIGFYIRYRKSRPGFLRLHLSGQTADLPATEAPAVS